MKSFFHCETSLCWISPICSLLLICAVLISLPSPSSPSRPFPFASFQSFPLSHIRTLYILHSHFLIWVWVLTKRGKGVSELRWVCWLLFGCWMLPRIMLVSGIWGRANAALLRQCVYVRFCSRLTTCVWCSTMFDVGFVACDLINKSKTPVVTVTRLILNSDCANGEHKIVSI